MPQIENFQLLFFIYKNYLWLEKHKREFDYLENIAFKSLQYSFIKLPDIFWFFTSNYPHFSNCAVM